MIHWCLWRIDAFEVWCWKRLLRVHCTARRSNQSILKEISPGISFFFFFSFSLENSLDLEKLSIFWATFISQQQQNTCKSPADRLPHLALVTSSFPLAWVRLVTVSCLESIQVSHYPTVRSPRAPFVSVSRCWGGRWKEKGVQRYRATSLHCEHQGPSTVGLHSCSKYSPLHKMYKTFI